MRAINIPNPRDRALYIAVMQYNETVPDQDKIYLAYNSLSHTLVWSVPTLVGCIDEGMVIVNERPWSHLRQY